MKKVSIILITIFAFILGITYKNFFNLKRQSEAVKVQMVIDGDTFIINNKQKVRLIGVNTPELSQSLKGKKTTEECFSQQSYLETKNLIEGKTVNMYKDVSNTDKYGRLLRYVYLGNLFINNYLVQQGYAKIMPINPDIKFASIFRNSQKEAQDNMRGLWSICPSKQK